MTLTVARMSGLSREEASRYSFLLSLPIIIGGFVFELPHFLKDSSVHFDLALSLWGIFISFATGLLAIHFFLKIIRKMGLWIFAVYRILFALVVLWIQ